MVETSVAIAVLPIGFPGTDSLITRWISPEDRAYAEKYRHPAAKLRSLLARCALRALLASRTDEPEWIFSTDFTGKLQVGAAKAPVEISIAHSENQVACAFSRIGSIGIDIEVHRPRTFEAIAHYGFGPHEQTLVAHGGMQAFYRIWTLREAMGKATGEGLALATDGRDHIQAAPEEGCWLSHPPSGPAWRLAHYFLDSGYSLGLALPGEDPLWGPDRIEWVDLTGATASGIPVENSLSKDS
jgi:phosphopantetheinyl transferase